MRLHSLEIKGFKSFPDKTVVHFDNKITGIVGPNGCGKSNIIDAIRWVVGEQKIANLRSENLESLVFNGSKTRSSSGVAEVILTFENTKNILPTEYSMVAISRRFYKTGESEYRLNDVACRLKDIQNLLLDTGIGSDSYSIIELGMVDDLIKDKDNSRRKLLEQAAGITIYKIRKKEAKQKLELTQNDLARIEDVLFEIAEQMKLLETQAKRAEKFNEFKKEYKEYSIQFGKLSTNEHGEKLQAINIEIQSVQDGILVVEINMSELNALLEKQKIQVIEKEKKLQEFQKKYNELLNAITQSENDQKLLVQRGEYLNDRVKNITGAIQNSSTQLQQLNQAVDLTKQQLAEQEENIKLFSDNVNLQKEKLAHSKQSIEQQKNHLENIRTENKKWQIQQFDLEKKIAVSEASLNNVNVNLQQIETDTNRRKDIYQNLLLEKEHLEQNLTHQQKELETRKEKNQQIKNLIIEQQETLELEREKLGVENRIFDAKKNEYELLKSVVEKMEGYPESVKFLFNNPNWVNRTIPILSDLIYVQEKYRTTIENYLNQYLNYYVVETREEAVMAVELLFSNQKGKANFLILEEFRHQIKKEKASTENTSNLISALTILETENAYEHLFDYLLGDVYIFNQPIESFATLHHNGVILIDMNGKIVHQQFSVSGGSIGLFEGNKIGRLKNLEKSLEFIHTQTKKVEEQKNRIAHIHQLIVTKNGEIQEQEVQQIQAKVNVLTNEKFALDNKVESTLSLDRVEKKKKEDLEKLKLNYEEGILINKNNLSVVRVDFEKTAELLKNSLVEFEKISTEFVAQQDLYNQTNLTFSQKQNYLNSLKQEEKFKVEQIQNLTQTLTANTTEVEAITKSIAELGEQINQKKNEVLNFYQQKELQHQDLVKEEQVYQTMKYDLLAKENELKQLLKTKEINDKQIAGLKDQATEIKLRLTSVKERLQAEFNIEIDDIEEATAVANMNLDELKTGIEKIKKRIENLGEINPMAIEAYQEIKTRYETIVAQKQDIVNAKDSLLQTIQEVEVTANQKFLETFNTVKDNFRKVFKALFTEEDECDLILENPENLAETSVNILAKPKGKKPSSITQLSGGEKTLTATALLFAIYLIKPAPFCILDEVDAPLDDQNVAKFTNMIRKFSDESQFIIVTHNKTTMSTVDVIYGVTMQERGVSKLVPVDFRNLD